MSDLETDAVVRLSAGRVAAVTRHGPVLSSGPGRGEGRRRHDRGTFEAALGPRDRAVIALLSLLWSACLVAFWQWWVQPVHQASAAGAVLDAVVLGYLTCFPSSSSCR